MAGKTGRGKAKRKDAWHRNWVGKSEDGACLMGEPMQTDIDEGLYSRQLYVLGHDAMRRMQVGVVAGGASARAPAPLRRTARPRVPVSRTGATCCTLPERTVWGAPQRAPRLAAAELCSLRHA
jgi:hypothetical protein